MYIFCQLPFIFGPSPFKGAHQKQPTHQRSMNVFSTFNVSVWTWTISLASRLALSRPVTSNCLFNNNLSLLCSNKEKTFYSKPRYYPLLVSSGHFPLSRSLAYSPSVFTEYYFITNFENASASFTGAIHSIFSVPVVRLPFFFNLQRIPTSQLFYCSPSSTAPQSRFVYCKVIMI